MKLEGWGNWQAGRVKAYRPSFRELAVTGRAQAFLSGTGLHWAGTGLLVGNRSNRGRRVGWKRNWRRTGVGWTRDQRGFGEGGHRREGGVGGGGVGVGGVGEGGLDREGLDRKSTGIGVGEGADGERQHP